MRRHIHTPKQSEWAKFIANSLEIDGYLITEGEVVRNRTSPTPKPLPMEMTNSCNNAWDFVLSESTPSPFELSLRIGRSLLRGATEEGACSGGQSVEMFLASQESLKSSIADWNKKMDKKTDFSIKDLEYVISSWGAHFSTLDEKMMEYLNRGFVPMHIQNEAAMFSWISQYQFAHWQPFPDANGLTGRFITNSLRLRWGMPLWDCDIKSKAWEDNLLMYVKFWRKKGYHAIPGGDLTPNLDKMSPQQP